jgi:alginate O-acetyltransferase complex protein AlgI
MALPHILVFSLAAVLVGGLARGRWRSWSLLVISLVAVYVLQPATPVRYLDFWLPTTSLALVVAVWAATRAPASVTGAPAAATEAKVARTPASAAPPSPDPAARRADWLAGGLIAAVVLLVALSRYADRSWVSWLTPSRPPATLTVIAALALSAGLTVALARFGSGRQLLISILAAVCLGIFVILKTDGLAFWASQALRAVMQQDVSQASALDWRWLGFSYIAFRLIHALRDRLTKRLPPLSLAEFTTYALFFPTLTAGPIDRADRFVKDLRQPGMALTEGGTRLIVGVFKKFVLADTLALFALSAVNAAQTTSTFWTWILLYAYAGRIYLDFSGYTDIALGLGRLMGFKLPENFDRPYLKPNLTVFWNSWHMTLAQWFRTYFFNPLTRALRSRPLPPWLIILIGQIGTMVLIGLWHGVTWNFAAWGLWHAVGLFGHSRWLEFARPRLAWLDERPRLQRVTAAASTLLTFHYVALGWVWFALPSLGLSVRVFGKLLGLNL